MKVYLDTSCLSRPFDDQAQQRVRMEAEAVKLILRASEGGRWRHVSSEIAIIEIEANPNQDKRRKVVALLPRMGDTIPNSASVFARAEILEKAGFTAADAVHVAAAEAQNADVFLTCDDRLLRVARRVRVAVRVANPLDWLQEQEHVQDA